MLKGRYKAERSDGLVESPEAQDTDALDDPENGEEEVSLSNRYRLLYMAGLLFYEILGRPKLSKFNTNIQDIYQLPDILIS